MRRLIQALLLLAICGIDLAHAVDLEIEVRGIKVHLRMSDLLPGTYALALYQDVNDDGKLDTRMDGKPLEPWGLSNNPKLEGRDPTWDEVQFVLPPEGKTLVIDLQ